MTANPFEENPARLPAIADFGGGAFLDDPEMPSIPTQQPTADDWNRLTKAVESLSRTAVALRIEIRFTGVTPAVHAISCTNSAMVISDISIDVLSPGSLGLNFPTHMLPPRRVGVVSVVQTDAPIVYWEAFSESSGPDTTTCTVSNSADTRHNFVVSIDGSG